MNVKMVKNKFIIYHFLELTKLKAENNLYIKKKI